MLLSIAIRRLLWAIPSTLGITLIAFLALAQLPASRTSANTARESEARSLPLFFNPDPEDLRVRVKRATDALLGSSEGSAEEEAARKSLVALGGAALPLLLPALDALTPQARSRVASALLGLAERMRLPGSERARARNEAVRFWLQFWETRGDDFRIGTARSRARRLAQYGTEARIKELFELDTFALPALIELLPRRVSAHDLGAARSLVGVLAHVTEQDDRIGGTASVDEAQACLERWRAWWIDAQLGFVALRGYDRIGASALETRFGRWAVRAIAVDVLSEEARRQRIDGLAGPARGTVTLLALGWLLSSAGALALGGWRAMRRGSKLERAAASLTLAPYAATLVVTGAVLVALGTPLVGPTVAASVALALCLVPRGAGSLTTAIGSALGEESAAAAIARGRSRLGAARVHGMRAAAVQHVAASTLALPTALSACFVLERLFGLDGLGTPLVDAVTRGDVGLPMALLIATAAYSTLATAAADVAACLLDPRLLPALTRVGRRV